MSAPATKLFATIQQEIADDDDLAFSSMLSRCACSGCTGDDEIQSDELLPDNSEISHATSSCTRIVRLLQIKVGEISMKLWVIFQPNLFL